jgi:hypothetical protein
MGRQTFRATLERAPGGRTATVVRVPGEVRSRLGRSRPVVIVTIGDHSYRSTVAAYGGEYLIPVNREHRDAAGVTEGDTVAVTIELDEAPRVVEPPDDLRAALAGAGALGTWERLSFLHQREYARWIDGARRPETRARRVAQTVIRVRAGSPVR